LESKSYRVERFPTEDCFDKRYCIVDAETGEILDDAQGYGYKSIRKAHAAWAYKTKGPKERAAFDANYKKIWDWLKEHQELLDLLEDEALYCLKGQSPFGVENVRAILKNLDMEAPFSAKDILRVWRNGPPKKRKNK